MIFLNRLSTFLTDSKNYGTTHSFFRLEEGADTDSADLPTTDYSKLLSSGHKLFMLPLDVILKNNVALSYFIDYMTSISAQAYLFFYLNVEGELLFITNLSGCYTRAVWKGTAICSLYE